MALAGGRPLPRFGFYSYISIAYEFRRFRVILGKRDVQRDFVEEDEVHVIDQNLTLSLSEIAVGSGTACSYLIEDLCELV